MQQQPEKTNKEEYKERFEHLHHFLLEICNAYHSWKGLQDKTYEPIYDQGKYFWSAVLIALQNEWLLNIAKCFEDSSRSDRNQVISVYALLKHYPDKDRQEKVREFLGKHKKVITHIQRVRDNQLVHLNAKYLANPKKLIEQFPIVYGEVEDLLSGFPELISLLNPQSGVGYSLDSYTRTPEVEAKYTMKKIQFYDKKEKEHMEKYVAGETDNPFLV